MGSIRQLDSVLNQMRSHGIDVSEIQFDKNFVRFGPKKSQWYNAKRGVTISGKECFVVFYGDWRTALSERAQSHRPKSITALEKKEFDETIENLKREIELERKREQIEAAESSRGVFNSAFAEGRTKYMERKQIDELYGARIQHETTLLIPMQTIDGEFAGCQQIFEDGKKYFWPGQRTKGAFHVVGDLKNEFCYVTEGFATASTIHKASGRTVVVAFSCYNLSEVVEYLKALGKTVVVCADNDRFTHQNPGLTKAISIKKEFKVDFILPTFPEDDLKSTDFNDLEIKKSLEAVKMQLGIGPSLIEQKKIGLFEIDETFTEETVKQSLVGDKLAASTSGNLFYDYEFDKWWGFSNRWHELSRHEIVKQTNDVMSILMPKGFSNQSLMGTFRQLAIEAGRKSETCDRDLVPFLNGYLDLRTKTFKDHSKDVFFDWCIPIAYTRERETKVIDQIFHNLAGRDQNDPQYAGRIQVLKAFLAATLRGMSHLHKYLELIGDPGAGKSTYMKLATMLIGEKNMVSSSLSILHDSSWETSTYFRKRLVIFPDESDWGGAGDKLKSITGGDPVRYEPKTKQIGPSFVYDGMVIVSANDHIRFKDKSSALVRRRVPIKIDSSIPENERDTHILDKARLELPALVNQLLDLSEEEIKWALSLESGLFTDASRESFESTNLVAQWLLDRCEFDAAFVSPVNGIRSVMHGPFSKPLYLDFKEYCENEGEKYVPSAVSFGKQLRSAAQVLGKDIQRGQFGDTRLKSWRGLRVKNNAQH